MLGIHNYNKRQPHNERVRSQTTVAVVRLPLVTRKRDFGFYSHAGFKMANESISFGLFCFRKLEKYEFYQECKTLSDINLSRHDYTFDSLFYLRNKMAY